ncbi:MAG: outer membrane beta-barrel protein [Pseudomonadota bacterium]
MKKLLIAFIAVGLLAFGFSAQAQESYVGGGFEAAGHVMAGGGWQRHNNQGVTYNVFDGDNAGYGPGVMGKYEGQAPAASTDYFGFFVDEVELDLMKSFGENIRLRADLDFGRVASSGLNTAAFVLEQAYATANIPVGNGIEFLLGRFNTPIGFEAADVIDNYTISKSAISYLRPINTTGAKIYYAFNDLVDLHFYVVNSLTQDSDAKINDVPSLGLRLGFNWGDDGESTLGISPFFGPETRASNKHFTFGGDVDLNWWVTEEFALGAEALFRRDNAFGAGVSNTEYLAGLLNLHYAFSDVWDGTLKYCFAKQFDPGNYRLAGLAANPLNAWNNLTGAEQSMHQIALAGGYAIADGAKLKLEGRFDMVKPAGAAKQYTYGLAMAFAYRF